MNQSFYKFFENIDRILMTLIIFLISIGLITLASASQQNIILLGNQIINILIGIVLLVFLSNIDPKRFLFYSPHLYIVSLILLLLVVFFGFESHGAKRWINLLFFNLQPSEIIKITIPLMLAWLYHRFQNTINYKIFKLLFNILQEYDYIQSKNKCNIEWELLKDNLKTHNYIDHSIDNRETKVYERFKDTTILIQKDRLIEFFPSLNEPILQSLIICCPLSLSI